jgi:hypothetical protein
MKLQLMNLGGDSLNNERGEDTRGRKGEGVGDDKSGGEWPRCKGNGAPQKRREVAPIIYILLCFLQGLF